MLQDAVEAYFHALESSDPYTAQLAAILNRVNAGIDDVEDAPDLEIEEPDF